MSGALLVELEAAPLERSEVDLVVAGFFRDERPLRDAAAAIDWRFCGLLSERLSEGAIAGDPGEAVLLPTYGRIRAARVMLLGLGRRAEYRLPRLVEAGRDALLRSAALGARSIALSPLGISPDDFARNAEPLLSGALAGVGEAGVSLRTRILLPQSGHGAAIKAIEELTATDAGDRLIFRRQSASPERRRALPLGIGPGL